MVQVQRSTQRPQPLAQSNRLCGLREFCVVRRRARMKNVSFTRWDPLRDLLALHEQLGHLVGTDAPGWTPPVDLYETAGDFVLTAELPGLTREQIEIHAEANRIVIRGARSADAVRDIPCEQYHRVERGHRRLSRAL